MYSILKMMFLLDSTIQIAIGLKLCIFSISSSTQYYVCKGLSWSWSYCSWIYHYLCDGITNNGVSSNPDVTLCDKVCQWLVSGRWFSLGSSVSSTNKIDRHNITEVLLKVALNTTVSPVFEMYWTNRIEFSQHYSYKYCWWIVQL